MSSTAECRETEAAVLEGEIAEVCGILNVATGRLVALIGRVLATEAYAGAGIRSPEQWVAWQCGVSLGRARSLVAMARRLPELPETRSALEAGELAEDQVAVICRYTPVRNDVEAADLGRVATVAQLKRTLSRYAFDEPVRPSEPERAKPEPEPDAQPEPEPGEARRVSFGFGDDGSWRLSAVLPIDEGALVERALTVARQRLFGGDADHGDAPNMVSWADAVVAMAETSLAAEAIARPHYDRHLVVIHVGADTDGQSRAHVHLGPALPDSLRRLMTCDAKARVQPTSTAYPSAWAARPASWPTAPAWPSKSVTAAVGSRVANAPGGSTCTISATGKTAGPPIPQICSPCVVDIIASTTEASSASPATPTDPTASLSPMPGVDQWLPAADPAHRPSRHQPAPGPIPPVSASKTAPR